MQTEPFREHDNDDEPKGIVALEALLRSAKKRLAAIDPVLYQFAPLGCEPPSIGERLESVYRREIELLEDALSIQN